MDYYQLLHVQQDAPPAMIKAAYQTLMQKLKMHPDLGGDAARAAAINEAYATLSNPARRAEYDRACAADTAATAANTDKKRSQTEQAAPDSPASREKPRQKKARFAKPRCLFCHIEVPGRIDANAECHACASPLQPLQRGHSRQDQRAIARMPARHSVKLLTSWPGTAIAGQLLDMSLHGAQFDSASELPVGAVVQLRSSYFTAVARVIRQVAARRYAVEFVSAHFRDSAGTFVSVQA